MWRWDDFLRQPVVKGRVAALPTSGQAEGDTYIFTGSGSNQNRLARWWATGATTAIWEYMPPRLGWRVQVANETTPSGQVKTYEFGASGWTELVGGMADAPSDGKAYARESGAWTELGSAAKSALNVLPFMNLMPDMGRFAGTAANPLATMFTTSWTPSTFINGWNGATLADGGQVCVRQQHERRGGAGAQCAGAGASRGNGPDVDVSVPIRGRVLHHGADSGIADNYRLGRRGWGLRGICAAPTAVRPFSTRARGRRSSCGCGSKAARLISRRRLIRPIAFGSMALSLLLAWCCLRTNGCICGSRCSHTTAMTTRVRTSTHPPGLRSRLHARRGSVASSIRVSTLHPS
ncbi:Protein of uncharacterised function (DUF2793) [Pseudomonas aeruginosa]|nr:Protein of uncharacterised function (DUF2793) [Pseudomonas aeruginosa]